MLDINGAGYDSPVTLYAGILPFPPQWGTVFAIAQDDMGQLVSKSCGLNLTQARFLYEVDYQRADNMIGQLARTLMLHANTATAVVKRLSSLQLVKQVVNKNDGRSTVILATEKGNEAAQQIDSVLGTYYRKLKGTLSKSEVENLMHIGNVGAKELNSFYERDGEPLVMQNYLCTTATCLLRLTNVMKPFGISLTEGRVLTSVITLQSPPRINSLSSHLGLRPNVISLAVDHLELLGLANRRADPKDGRATNVAYTAKGFDVFSQIADAFIPTIVVPAAWLNVVPISLTTHLFRRRGRKIPV